jgi:Holliday junction resolvase
MAATPEKRVKNKVIKILKEFGAYYFYASTGGFGKSGVPDIIACYEGRFLGIECKAGKNKPTTLQRMNLKEIDDCGGYAMLINEENIEYVRSILDGIRCDAELST